MSQAEFADEERAGAPMAAGAPPRLVPLWLKIVYTLMICLVVLGQETYAWSKLLWLCNVAFLGLLLALWLESRLIASMMAVGTLFIALGWSLDFLSGARLLGQVGFMFDPEVPLTARLVNLDHLVLPPLLLWLVYRLGYDSRAMVAQSLLMLAVLVLSHLLTDPAENINLVYGYRAGAEDVLVYLGLFPSALQPWVYLAGLAVGTTLLMCVPTHWLLRRWFSRPAGPGQGSASAAASRI